ncbi:MAG: hypothetical protein Q8P67_26300 [archaeon]|nr:hypothetical protein [archaeon]
MTARRGALATNASPLLLASLIRYGSSAAACLTSYDPAVVSDST